MAELYHPPTASKDPLGTKTVESFNGVSVRVCHGDGVDGEVVLADCETAWEMSSSKHTLNTSLLAPPFEEYPLDKYHMFPLIDEDNPEYISGNGEPSLGPDK